MNTKATTPRTGGGTASAETRQPLAVPPEGWPRDNYTGLYGRFKRDPYTGIREPADDETRKAMAALGITTANGEISETAPAAGPDSGTPSEPAGGTPA